MGLAKSVFTTTMVLYGVPRPVAVLAENVSEAQTRAVEAFTPVVAKATGVSAPDTVKAAIVAAPSKGGPPITTKPSNDPI